jgi:ParB-like chromosome segregation protein Spo0J
MNPVENILGKRIRYDSKSCSKTIIHIPTKKAYAMRARGNIFGDMTPKRTPETMERIEQGILHGNFEPIEATRQDIEEGILHEGKHRILIAMKLGMKTVPIIIVDS